MTGESLIDHLSLDELIDYFDLKLAEDREGLLEAHLALCADCNARARKINHLNAALDRWTAQAHGEAYLRDTLQNALASVANPVWQERLAAWSKRWAGKAEGALRIIMEAPRKAARLSTDGLEAVIRPGGRWQFSLLPELKPTTGPVFSRGKHHSEEPHRTIAFTAQKPGVKVAVSGETSEIVIRADDLLPGRARPLVLLIPIEKGHPPQLVELMKLPGLPYLMGRFEGIAPGDYLMVFEPVAESLATR